MGGEEPRCPELSIRQRAGRSMPIPQEVGEPIAGLGGRWKAAKKFFRFKWGFRSKRNTEGRARPEPDLLRALTGLTKGGECSKS